MLSANLSLFLRNAAIEIGIPHTTIWRFLREVLKLFSYKLRIYQENNDGDMIKRIDFAKYYHNELKSDSKFLRQIGVSNECKFSMLGKVN